MREISDIEKAAILKAANDAVLRVVGALGSEQTGKGGHFRACLLRSPRESFIGLVPICEGWVGGKANVGGQEKYGVFCDEELYRLTDNAAIRGDVASSESRCEERHKYAGAVLMRCILNEDDDEAIYLLLSFSGLPPQADEAAMILLGSNWAANADEVKKITERTQNELAWDLIRERQPEMDIGERPTRLL